MRLNANENFRTISLNLKFGSSYKKMHVYCTSIIQKCTFTYVKQVSSLHCGHVEVLQATILARYVELLVPL